VQGTRILIIVENSWIPIDRRVWYEATALRDAGWQVTVVCPIAKGAHAGKGPEREPKDNPDYLDGIETYSFPLTFAESGVTGFLMEYLAAFFSIARLSWRIWRSGGFEIVHICNPPDILFPIGLLYRLLGARFVFDHHDLFPENVRWRYRGIGGRFMYVLARLAEYLTFRSANVVISTNESYRQVALDRGGLPAERVVVVRNGPRIKEFMPLEPVATLRRGFRFMVCYVGVMGDDDGILEMVEVIRYIVADLGRRDVLFALVGDGACRGRAMTEIVANGLEPLVDMPGLIRDEFRLRQYMSTADVFVSPEPLTPMNARSTFVKVGEYMAIGKPIVAFDLAETRYTAQEAAYYVAPGDIRGFGRAILELLDDPERRRMGESGRQRILDQLGWEHQKLHLFRAYALAQDHRGQAMVRR